MQSSVLKQTLSDSLCGSQRTLRADPRLQEGLRDYEEVLLTCTGHPAKRRDQRGGAAPTFQKWVTCAVPTIPRAPPQNHSHLQCSAACGNGQLGATRLASAGAGKLSHHHSVLLSSCWTVRDPVRSWVHFRLVVSVCSMPKQTPQEHTWDCPIQSQLDHVPINLP